MDLDRWTPVSDADSVRGTAVFRPTHDPIVAWNDETGLRLQRRTDEEEYYLALRDGNGRQQWRVAPYPIARDLADFFRRTRFKNIRLKHHASEKAAIEILILSCGRSVWAALNVAPSPAVLMGLFLHFPPPIRFTWPGRVDLR